MSALRGMLKALIIVLILLLSAECAGAEQKPSDAPGDIGAAIDAGAQNQLNALDISALAQTAQRLWQGMDLRGLMERLRTGEGLDAEAALRAGLKLMGELLRGRAGFVTALVICAALAGMAGHMCQGGARVSDMACLCAAAGLMAGDMAGLVAQARAALSAMGEIADALLPLISGVMTALGANVASGLLGGLLTTVAGAGMRFGREWVMGLALASAALEICAGLGSRIRLSKAAELMRTLSGMLVGAALVIVLGSIKVNGSLGADIDGIKVRAAKYALDNIVPVVGGEIKDTVEVMAASCLMVQSVLGSCGMILLLMSAAQPVLSLAAGYISYKACAAAAQALGGDRLGAMSEGMAKVLRTLMIAVLGAAALMIMLLGALGTAARALLA